jgi:hypothetical protein
VLSVFDKAAVGLIAITGITNAPSRDAPGDIAD